MPNDDINLLPEDMRAKERQELERVQKTPRVIPVPLSSPASPSGQARPASFKAAKEPLLARLFRRPAAPKFPAPPKPLEKMPAPAPAQPRLEIMKPQLAEVKPVSVMPAAPSRVSGGPALPPLPPSPVVAKPLYGAPEPERAQVLKAIRELPPLPAGAPKQRWWQIHWHTFRVPTFSFRWLFRRRPKMPKVKVMPAKPPVAPAPLPAPRPVPLPPTPRPIPPVSPPPPPPPIAKPFPPLTAKPVTPPLPVQVKPVLAKPPEKPVAKKPEVSKPWHGLGINLLPEEFGARPELELPRKFLTIGVSVFSALLVVGLFYLWLTAYQIKVAQEIRDLEGQLAVINHQIEGYEDERKTAINLQQLLRYVQDLLVNHTYWTEFFQKLEGYTLPEVYYTGFSMSGTDQLALQAVGRDYTSAAKQLVAFENAADFVQSVTISSVAAKFVPDTNQIAETNFTITLKLKPGVFLKAPGAP